MIRDEQHRSSEEPVSPRCIKYNTKGSREKADFAEALEENEAERTNAVASDMEVLDNIARAQIDIAIDEIFGNIANYAYAPEEGPATVRMEAEADPMRISITFIDHGIQYNPLSAEDPDVTLSARERRAGGLGVFMVKNMRDTFTYDYRDEENIMTICKVLGS